jgi:alpha-glucosidase (family GH31 glycosyl hydrolase)
MIFNSFKFAARPALGCAIMVLFAGLQTIWAGSFQTKEQGGTIIITTGNYQIAIIEKGFRYSFQRADGTEIAPPHAESGLQFHGANAAQTRFISAGSSDVKLEVVNQAGERAEVLIEPKEHSVRFDIRPEHPGEIVARTGGVAPSFGLGDTGGRGHVTTDLTGFKSDNLHSDGKIGGRLISNFVIFPQAGLAEVNIEPLLKIVRLTKEENAQGSKNATEMTNLFYFFGTPKTIYKDFLDVRNQLGYKVYVPKYEWFGVGWEAFGALAYNTSQKTVTENLDHYLNLGYPISWMVLGSGFWPHTNDNYQATTSFGFWDADLYPDPKGLIERYHRHGIKFILGLRIAFITEGPYAAEGVRHNYFITENGRPKVYKILFPRKPVYLLDATKPDAVKWYLGLCQKWLDYGVDGFKEDLFGYEKYVLRDDKLNPVNEALMDRGIYLMGRNGYLGSPMDLHRFDDFNYDQKQDRGPINGLALAYSGLPYVYPDIIGGKFVPDIISQLKTTNGLSDPGLKRYFMRNAQYASVNPSMSVGFGPWNFHDPQLEKVVLDAVKLHAQLHPYIYSAAVDAARSGFPYTLTPLSLAYPDDPNVYHLENSSRRAYEWLLGPSLLATPLYGDDCMTANTRDVYLPAGQWLDYDTGKIYTGPKTLKHYQLPVGKTPLFVGGDGVLVLRQLDGDQLHARVYPVAIKDITYQFTYKDGVKNSKIINPAQPWKPAEMTVLDIAINQEVDFTNQTVTGAVEFTIVPGHDYRLAKKVK